MLIHRMLICLCMAALPLHGGAQAAPGGNYPAQAVRIIVPFSPGGPADMIGRLIAAELQQSMGQSVVVENHPGAGGTLGAGMVAKARPDGYTLLLSNIADTWGSHIFKSITYDFQKDFAPVSKIAATAFVLVANARMPFEDLGGLLKYAKEHPGKLTYGSAGVGVSSHLAGELLSQVSGTELRHVAYKGQSQAMNDLLGGHIEFLFASPVTAIPLVKAGTVRAIATTGPERIPLLPDVPTISASGVPGYDVDTWFGLSAPAGTPEPVIRRLYRGIAEALAKSQVRERLMAQGTVVIGNSPEEFARQIAAEAAKWGTVLAKANLATN